VSTKLVILGELAKKVDQLIVGGGIANTFMLAAGLAIGKSLAEADLVGEARSIMACPEGKRRRCAPSRWTWFVRRNSPPKAKAPVTDAKDVAADDLILDIGPKTAANLPHYRQGRHDSSGTARSAYSNSSVSAKAQRPSRRR
jgi:phosphoglycerate kinase